MIIGEQVATNSTSVTVTVRISWNMIYDILLSVSPAIVVLVLVLLIVVLVYHHS